MQPFPLDTDTPYLDMAPGVAILCYIDCTQSGKCTTDAFSLLDNQERARVVRMPAEGMRYRFVVAHAALRRILGTYLRCAPQQVVFSYEDRGKPRLDMASGHEPLYFNFSHAGDYALCGITKSGDIGVDIERKRVLTAFERMCKKVCSPAEYRLLQSLTDPERSSRLFFRFWSRKEAITKCVGQGLSAGFSTIDVQDSRCWATPVRWPQAHAPLHVYDIEAPNGYYAAVAMTHPVDTLSVYWYTPAAHGMDCHDGG
jgi:4'-phosphopantetheinyl transferase